VKVRSESKNEKVSRENTAEAEVRE